MRRFIVFAIGSLFFQTNVSFAVEVGYKFSGTVTNQFAAPYGKPMPATTPVVGKFIYDTASSATHNLSGCGSGTCTGYEQHIVNGFVASFGNVVVRADDYIAAVFNNVPGIPASTLSDVFAVRFISNLSPLLTSPLVVDGTNQSTGWFNLSLAGSSSVFPDASLPSILNPADFPVAKRSGILSHTDTGGIDVLFSVTSLTKFEVLPGDYNLDESVNDADYAVWRSGFGATADLTADGNRNGIVDAADYVAWRLHSSAGQPGGRFSMTTVPETGPTLLLLLGLITVVAFREGTIRHLR